MKIAKQPKTVELKFDPFEWPLESYIEQLESCPQRCREGLKANVICDACADALTMICRYLRQTCPVCGAARAPQIACAQHE